MSAWVECATCMYTANDNGDDFRMVPHPRDPQETIRVCYRCCELSPYERNFKYTKKKLLVEGANCEEAGLWWDGNSAENCSE